MDKQTHTHTNKQTNKLEHPLVKAIVTRRQSAFQMHFKITFLVIKYTLYFLNSAILTKIPAKILQYELILGHGNQKIQIDMIRRFSLSIG